MKEEILKGIQAIKAKFEEVPVVEEKTFAEVTLVDGETVLSYEGELAEGTAVFLVGEDGEQIPAPEGTHSLGGEMVGTSIVVNAEGIIESVVTEDVVEEEAAAVEEAMSSESINALVEEKMAAITAPINALCESFAKYMDAQDEKFTALEEKLAKFSAAPSADKGKKKFERADNLTPRQRQMLSRVETIKNRK